MRFGRSERGVSRRCARDARARHPLVDVVNLKAGGLDTLGDEQPPRRRRHRLRRVDQLTANTCDV
jgi:hypothetical protein